MFYLTKRQDEKQCTPGEVVMCLSDFNGINAGDKGVVIEVYTEGVMIAWAQQPKDRTEKLITLQMIGDKLDTGEPFMAAHGWRMDGFGRDELQYLAFASLSHPDVNAAVYKIN